jgi:chemotaxis protein methyltransferase CheR
MLMPQALAAQELEEIELNLMMEGVLRRYGYELRNFSRSLLKRRIATLLQEEGLATLSALQERMLREEEFAETFVASLTTGSHAMFRDPAFHAFLRTEILPMLRTYPSIRVWVPGCAGGQDAYAIAILLAEEDLYERSKIYATDMGAGTVRRAKHGSYPMASARKWAVNHAEGGGKAPLEDYFDSEGGQAVFKSSLKRNMVFAQHCLAGDGSINEFQLILCRNALPSFDEGLRGRIQGLLDQSLSVFGYLALGGRERPSGAIAHRYQQVNNRYRLYRKAA